MPERYPEGGRPLRRPPPIASALAVRRSGAGRAGVEPLTAVDDDLQRGGRLAVGTAAGHRPRLLDAGLRPRARALEVHAPVAPVVVGLAVDLVVVDDHGRVAAGRRIH